MGYEIVGVRSIEAREDCGNQLVVSDRVSWCMGKMEAWGLGIECGPEPCHLPTLQVPHSACLGPSLLVWLCSLGTGSASESEDPLLPNSLGNPEFQLPRRPHMTRGLGISPGSIVV